ncbi:MAG: flagellar basal body P-ring protein FlgI [Sedimentisphaerales bacterium]|nr:flagellar basal body P-ring protein FlgI [Sedimentisphaerales bacterium]
MNKYALLVLLAAIGYGCGGPPGRTVVQPAAQAKTPESLGVTIGSLCELMGYDSVRLKGHALVWGLPGTGSGECPPFVKEYLSQHIQKLQSKGFIPEQYANMTAEQIISSHSTAVVGVSGTVPAGAPKGSRFDVDVFIPWSTQTTSLQGGRLLLTELQQVVPGLSGRLLAGRSSAFALGPLFINPFPLSSDSSKLTDPRRAVILGGGRTSISRQIQLSLLDPDSSIAQQIQKRINSRFQPSDGKKVADAVNRSVVNIAVPKLYRERYHHFLQLLLGLYLQDSAAFQELKLRELSEMANREEADYEAIALVWEAIGRNALKDLEAGYRVIKGKKAFYAAQAALGLGDKKAIDALIKMAEDDHHPSRERAMRVLARAAGDVRGGACLSRLLNSPNTRVRLLAYSGLRHSRNRRVRTTVLPYEFQLDSINTTGESLICIWAICETLSSSPRDKGEPRIIVFGRNLYCRRNVFFETPEKTVTINSRAGDDKLTISRKISGKEDYVTIQSSRAVEDLILAMARPLRPKDKKQKAGAGLTFSQIIGILHQLCERRVIPARFILLRKPEDIYQS